MKHLITGGHIFCYIDSIMLLSQCKGAGKPLPLPAVECVSWSKGPWSKSICCQLLSAAHFPLGDMQAHSIDSGSLQASQDYSSSRIREPGHYGSPLSLNQGRTGDRAVDLTGVDLKSSLFLGLCFDLMADQKECTLEQANCISSEPTLRKRIHAPFSIGGRHMRDPRMALDQTQPVFDMHARVGGSSWFRDCPIRRRNSPLAVSDQNISFAPIHLQL